MALIQVNFVSKALLRTVTVNVILPVDKFSLDPNAVREEKPFKTLYLLHGIFGNYTDWVSGTRVQRWAEAKDLAVVMPSGENGFYVDQPGAPWNNYGRFIGEELVEVSRRMFPLSRRREDTFIGGLSMGGFGAIRNGLKYHGTFGRIVGLSNAIHILEEGNDAHMNVAYEESCFGSLAEARKTDKNPRLLIKQLAAAKAADPALELPKVFLACGTEDGLIGVNRVYRDLFRASGFDVTYCESAGGHTWDFWDQYIGKVIDEWLPLDGGRAGVNSGNVNG